MIESMRLRPMVATDAPAAADVVGAAADAADRKAGRPPGEPPTPQRRERFVSGLARFPATDPDGSWVAEAPDGRLVGLGLAVRRDALWGLSMLFVHPDHQSQGLGRRLLDRCWVTGTTAAVRMIMTSDDPRALRRYALTGLQIHPAVRARGKIDRAALAAGLTARDGDASDLDLVTAVDLPLRGASRAGDVAAVVQAGARLFVSDRAGRRGFVVARDGSPVMLGADHPEVAQDLLWRAFAQAEPDTEVEGYGWTAQQGWAVTVALAARLAVSPAGPLFVSGTPVPGPWLPSGWYF